MRKHTIYFGVDTKARINPDADFFGSFIPDWLEDPLVKEMILDIDKSEVKSKNCIESPILGQIPPEYLSGGVKTLIMLLKRDFYYPDLMVCGENCAKWFSEIAKQKELKLALSSFDMPYINIPLVCENDDSEITTARDWVAKRIDFLRKSSR